MLYYLPGLTPGATYYWRVDEIDATGAVQAGNVWSFIAQDLKAYHPAPADGANDTTLAPNLTWLPGQTATQHHVYFGDSNDAVSKGTAAADKGELKDPNFAPGALDSLTTYYWRVDEAVLTGPVRTGSVWTFTTCLPVDDFESYTDQAGSEIFAAWLDGFTDGLSGSTVGYLTAANGTYGETVIVHGGKQSMPLDYNNVHSPFYSEAEREFSPAQNWTLSNTDTLVLYLRGNPIRFQETAPGSVTMSGGGADIWDTADQFRFAFKRLTGNGTIVAKVESIDNVDPWTKAGVMIRENLDAGSRFAAVYATPGQGVRFQARLLNMGAATSDTSVATAEQMALKTPIWIKLERSGSAFSGFYSTDGAKWTAMSWNPQTISMNANVYVGLALTSHNTAAMATGSFSNLAMTSATGAWSVAEIGVAQPGNDPAPLYVVVEDSSGRTKIVTHPDLAATANAAWQAWKIPLADISSAGVNLKAVKKLSVGVGDRASPTKGGAGMLYIDDIGVGHPAQ